MKKQILAAACALCGLGAFAADSINLLPWLSAGTTETVSVKENNGTKSYTFTTSEEWAGPYVNFADHFGTIDLSEYESITFDLDISKSAQREIYFHYGDGTEENGDDKHHNSEYWGTDPKWNEQSVTIPIDQTRTLKYVRIKMETPVADCPIYSIVLNSKTKAEPKSLFSCSVETGNWANQTDIPASQFESLTAGDKLIFLYENAGQIQAFFSGWDTASKPEPAAWNLIRDNGDYADVAAGTTYEVTLTADEVDKLKQKGLTVNGNGILFKGLNVLSSAIVDAPTEVIYPTKIDIALVDRQLYGDDHYQLVPIFYPANTTARSLHWSSTNEAVATVDQNGYVFCNGPGDVGFRVRGYDKDGKELHASVATKVLPREEKMEADLTGFAYDSENNLYHKENANWSQVVIKAEALENTHVLKKGALLTVNFTQVPNQYCAYYHVTNAHNEYPVDDKFDGFYLFGETTEYHTMVTDQTTLSFTLDQLQANRLRRYGLMFETENGRVASWELSFDDPFSAENQEAEINEELFDTLTEICETSNHVYKHKTVWPDGCHRYVLSHEFFAETQHGTYPVDDSADAAIHNHYQENATLQLEFEEANPRVGLFYHFSNNSHTDFVESHPTYDVHPLGRDSFDDCCFDVGGSRVSFPISADIKEYLERFGLIIKTNKALKSVKIVHDRTLVGVGPVEFGAYSKQAHIDKERFMGDDWGELVITYTRMEMSNDEWPGCEIELGAVEPGTTNGINNYSYNWNAEGPDDPHPDHPRLDATGRNFGYSPYFYADETANYHVMSLDWLRNAGDNQWMKDSENGNYDDQFGTAIRLFIPRSLSGYKAWLAEQNANPQAAPSRAVEEGAADAATTIDYTNANPKNYRVVDYGPDNILTKLQEHGLALKGKNLVVNGVYWKGNKNVVNDNPVEDAEVTGIAGIDAEEQPSTYDVYTVTGIRLRHAAPDMQTATSGLAKGIYIINGSKYAVR